MAVISQSELKEKVLALAGWTKGKTYFSHENMVAFIKHGQQKFSAFCLIISDDPNEIVKHELLIDSPDILRVIDKDNFINQQVPVLEPVTPRQQDINFRIEASRFEAYSLKVGRKNSLITIDNENYSSGNLIQIGDAKNRNECLYFISHIDRNSEGLKENYCLLEVCKLDSQINN